MVAWYPIISTASSPIVTIFNTSGFFLAIIAKDCILLLIHLSYYIIAFYIRLLRFQLITKNTKIDASSNPDSCWKGSKIVLHHLQRACAEISGVFSVPVLLIIAIHFAIVSYNLYAIIYGMVKANVLLTNIYVGWLVLSAFSGFVNVFIILHAADMPIKQVKFVHLQNVNCQIIIFWIVNRFASFANKLLQYLIVDCIDPQMNISRFELKNVKGHLKLFIIV